MAGWKVSVSRHLAPPGRSIRRVNRQLLPSTGSSTAGLSSGILYIAFASSGRTMWAAGRPPFFQGSHVPGQVRLSAPPPITRWGAPVTLIQPPISAPQLSDAYK